MKSDTSSNTAPEIFKLLGHDLRWQLLKALTLGDLRVNELVALTGQPQNLVSYHLKKLRDFALVSERRSSADSRALYYSLDLESMSQLYRGGGTQLHPLMLVPRLSDSIVADIGQHPRRVLFLCTHNSARSQIAEGLLRERSQGNCMAFSAGTDPTIVHPLTIRVMDEIGVDIRQQRSKHLNEFQDKHFDFTITVCDQARESCPVFPGDPLQLHWSYPDPLMITGPESAQQEAFRKLAEQLDKRITAFLLAIECQILIS